MSPSFLRCFDLWVLYLVFMTNWSIKSVYTVNENNSNGCSDLLTQSAVNVTDLCDFWHWPSICGLHQTLPGLRTVSHFYQWTTKKGSELVWDIEQFYQIHPYSDTPPTLSSTKIKRKEMEQLQEFHKYPWCYWKHKCMKMMNGIEMSHGMSLILIHVPNLW